MISIYGPLDEPLNFFYIIPFLTYIFMVKLVINYYYENWKKLTNFLQFLFSINIVAKKITNEKTIVSLCITIIVKSLYLIFYITCLKYLAGIFDISNICHFLHIIFSLLLMETIFNFFTDMNLDFGSIDLLDNSALTLHMTSPGGVNRTMQVARERLNRRSFIQDLAEGNIERTPFPYNERDLRGASIDHFKVTGGWVWLGEVWAPFRSNFRKGTGLIGILPLNMPRASEIAESPVPGEYDPRFKAFNRNFASILYELKQAGFVQVTFDNLDKHTGGGKQFLSNYLVSFKNSKNMSTLVDNFVKKIDLTDELIEGLARSD